MNDQSIPNNFAILERLIEQNRIEPETLFNLDEVGATSEKDFSASNRRRILSHHSFTDADVADFSYKQSIIMMPVVSALGECGPTLFVFKEKLHYRKVVRGDVE